MSTLVIAEHDNSSLKPATLNAVAAAQAMGAGIDILVAGANCGAVADQAAAVAGVGKVLLADNAAYEHQLAENVSLLIAELGASYDNIIAPSTSNGKTPCRVLLPCWTSPRSPTLFRWNPPTLSSVPSTPATSLPRSRPPMPSV